MMTSGMFSRFQVLRFMLILLTSVLLTSCGGGGGSNTPTTSTPQPKLLGGAIQGQALSLTGTVSTYAGSGTAGSMDGVGTAAEFDGPNGITTDGTNLYVADALGNQIRKIVIATGEVTTLAGSGVAGNADGTGGAAQFSFPAGITTDGTNLYVADFRNNEIRQIVIATGAVTTIAGSGTAGEVDGTGTAAQFNQPACVTMDNTFLYVSDYKGNTIRKIDIATHVVTTIAGSGVPGNADGTGVQAEVNGPLGIVTDGPDLYLLDSNNNTIRKIVIATGEVTTFAGSGVMGNLDGTGTAAQFSTPYFITTDGVSLYVTDNDYGTVRKVDIGTGVVTTFAGTVGKFPNIYGITTDGQSLYIADQNNNIISVLK